MRKQLLIIITLMLLGLSAKAVTNAAFIYNTDLTDAQSFETLLEANGFAVTLIPVANVATTNYSTYDVVITSPATILSASQADVIKALSKPIVGLGSGGYRSLGAMALEIGSPYGMSGNANKMYVENAALDVFNSPIDISINTGDSIQVYTGLASASPARMIYVPTAKSYIEGILQFKPLYYSVIRQNSKYTFWGFSLSAANMTQHGKDLFVNTITDAITVFSKLPTALPAYGDQNELQLHFNPQTKLLTVEGFDANMELSVIDLNGKTLFKHQIQNKIHLTNLQKGIYVARVKTSNTVISQKIRY